MKLSEITNKERFVNQLKDPRLEKVRVGLEKLSKIFNAQGWNFETKLDDGLYFVYITQKQLPLSVKNNMYPLNQMQALRTMFPNKFILRYPEEEDSSTFVYSIDVYQDFHSG